MSKKININKNAIKNVAIIGMVFLALGFYFGIKYQNDQTAEINTEVAQQLSSLKK